MDSSSFEITPNCSTGMETAAPGLGRTGGSSQTALETFLLNEPNTVRMPTYPPYTAGNTKHYNRASVFGGYVQDDWKFRPNLTFNVGLRYEMSTIPNEIDGKFVILPQLWTNPGNCTETITGLPNGCGALRNGKVFNTNPTVRNFEPRVGFAWDPFNSGKTSVRGGFGIFDVLPMPFMFGLNALQASPSGAELDMTNATSCVEPVLVSTLACPIAQGSYSQGLPGDVTNSGITAAGSGRWQYTNPQPQAQLRDAMELEHSTPAFGNQFVHGGLRGIQGNSQPLSNGYPQYLLPAKDFGRLALS